MISRKTALKRLFGLALGGFFLVSLSKLVFADYARRWVGKEMILFRDDGSSVWGIAGNTVMGTEVESDWVPLKHLGINFGDLTRSIKDQFIGGEFVHTDDGGGFVFGGISAKDNSTETTIAVAGTKVQVTIFDTNGENVNTTPDHTNDHVTVSKPGKYFVMVNSGIDSVTGAASNLTLGVYKNNGATGFSNLDTDQDMAGGGGEVTSVPLSGLIDLALDDTLEVWITNNTNTQNYVVENITLSLLQIGG